MVDWPHVENSGVFSGVNACLKGVLAVFLAVIDPKILARLESLFLSDRQ